AMQVLPPNQFRAQLSALFLLVSHLMGLGLVTTLVALLTDRVFGTPKAVGDSMAVLISAATLACIVLLGAGCGAYRRSLARERAAVSPGAAMVTTQSPPHQPSALRTQAAAPE